jgi:uncharacterized protein (TIGR02757 family)
MNSGTLKDLLETLYIQYERKFSSKDPVWMLHRFGDEKDIEITGLITSAYCYGQVDLINRFIGKLLDRMGNKPYEFTINFEKRKDKKHIQGLAYRFNTENDLANLLEALRDKLRETGSLERLFLNYYDKDGTNVSESLAGFMSSIRNGSHSFLIPGPGNGSTCKRMNLFLRWMVRKDEIDTGIWKEIDKAKLVMPVDVHVARIAKKLELVKRKSVDMKFAVELTNRLREFDAEDPVKYDFALCHIGIEGKNLTAETLRR